MYNTMSAVFPEMFVTPIYSIYPDTSLSREFLLYRCKTYLFFAVSEVIRITIRIG